MPSYTGLRNPNIPDRHGVGSLCDQGLTILALCTRSAGRGDASLADHAADHVAAAALNLIRVKQPVTHGATVCDLR